MSGDAATPCVSCGHDAREHGQDGCLRGWSEPLPWRYGCTCDHFVFAKATDLSSGGSVRS